MTLALPKEKLFDIQNRCSQVLVSQEMMLLVVTKFLGEFASNNSSCAPKENSVQVLAKSTNSGHEVNSGGIKILERKITSSKQQTSEDRNTRIKKFKRRLPKQVEGQFAKESK